MAKETWVIVANSALARFFKLEGMTLIEMPALVHPEGRMKTDELVSDAPGATWGSSAYSTSRYQTGQQTPPKKIEDIQFARDVANQLEAVRAKGQVNKIYIAASPAFLGLLRGEMTKGVEGIVESAVPKDIVHLNREEIRTYFPIGL